MIENNKLTVPKGNSSKLLDPMNWEIYSRIINHYSGKNFRILRLRVAIFLLAVTGSRISQILVLKAGYLQILQEEFLVKIEPILINDNLEVFAEWAYRSPLSLSYTATASIKLKFCENSDRISDTASI